MNVCGVEAPNGAGICALESGHGGPHAVKIVDVEIPADLGRVVDGILSGFEKAREELDRELVRNRRLRWLLLVALALNLAAAGWNFAGAVG